MMQNSSSIGPGPARTLNLDALRSFVAICETGTFRRASTRVHRSASAVSLQVAGLEEILGARLMERNARRMTLTDAGEDMLIHARRMLGAHDDAMAEFRGSTLTGRLCLAAPHDLGVSIVPDLLRRIARSHPHVVVDVRLGASAAVLRAFEDGVAEVVLFNDGDAPPIPARRLRSEPMAWLMHRGGRAIAGDPLPLAVAEAGCAWREMAIRGLEACGRNHRIAYASDTSMGQIAAVRADLAIAALPASLAEGDVVAVPDEQGAGERRPEIVR